MKYMSDILLSLAFMYVIPVCICYVWSVFVLKESPLSRYSHTRDWTFMPVMNFFVSCAILFYVIIYRPVDYVFCVFEKFVKWIRK